MQIKPKIITINGILYVIILRHRTKNMLRNNQHQKIMIPPNVILLSLYYIILITETIMVYEYLATV